MKTRSSTTLAFVFATLAVAAPIANAKLQSAEIQTARVDYADLNLATAEDQATLHERLRRAARDVCDINAGRSAREATLLNQCADQAVERALGEIGKRELTSVNYSASR